MTDMIENAGELPEVSAEMPEIETSEAPASTAQAASIGDLRPRMEMRGKVKKIELFGAFVDLGVGKDGLLHISQLGVERVKNVRDVLKEGDEVTVWIKSVDTENGRIDLTMVKQHMVAWNEIREGGVFTGKVIRMERFGAFVDIGAERPGMVHVSEMTSGYINSPEDAVKLDQEVQVKVIKVTPKKKQIDLSIKALEEPVVMPREEENEEELPTAMALALRRAMRGTDMAAEYEAGQQSKEPRRKTKDQREDKRRREQDEIIARTLQNRVK